MAHARVDNCKVGTHPVVVLRLLKECTYNARPPLPRISYSCDVIAVVESLTSLSTEHTLLWLAKKGCNLNVLK